ncbi:MAG: UxaA family hydrolase [Aminivibrio sp.]|jgi:altronate hydrolase
MKEKIIGEVRCIVLNSMDNVATLPGGGKAGQSLAGPGVVLREDVSPGHKAALRAISEGEPVIKYGHTMGRATKDIMAGEWVHVHNVESSLSTEWDMEWRSASPSFPAASAPVPMFMGYEREQGPPGIRNELWIIPLVGCINDYLKFLAGSYSLPPWIGRIRVLAHPYGCSQLGDDLDRTAAVLEGLARNPCAAGVVLAGLGCENLQRIFMEARLSDLGKARFFSLQEEEDDEEKLYALLDELAEGAPRERKPFPLSDVTVGVKCGGSDGYSGLSANPLVGEAADMLCSWGGRVVATEIPEMFGAEDVIASRIGEEDVFRNFAATIRWFRDYFDAHGQPVYENPSPGNKEGGLTTLEEKSLGAVTKCGASPVSDVLPMGAQADRRGVSVIFGPGNDLVSSTAMAAGGAQIILFTTGRGTPYSTVVPTLKISSNTALFNRKKSWTDFDAGPLLEGADRVEAAKALVALMADTASGQETRGEKNLCGEIGIFKDGVTL